MSPVAAALLVGHSDQDGDRLLITSADVRAARSCATKLFYRRQRYPRNDDGDSRTGLADGSLFLKPLARLRFPDGRAIAARDPDHAVAETAAALRGETAALFDAAFFADGVLVRVDVLVRSGDRLDIFGVVARPFDLRKGVFTKSGGVRTEWRPSIEELALQRSVVAAVHPGLEVHGFLIAPDKTAAAEIDAIPTLFRVVDDGGRITVEFTGDAALFRASPLQIEVPVDAAVEIVAADVQATVASVRASLLTALAKVPGVPRYACRDCEYRVDEATSPNGFSECWGDLATEEPSLFDLALPNTIRDEDGQPMADALIAQGKVSLYDIPLEALRTKNGPRQKLQIAHTRSRTEWRSSELRSILERLPYPLHFIDFETCTPIVPHHAGMRPNEFVAFQWSCHTLDEPGGELRHREWLNSERTCPNEEFARTLRAAVGDTGTLLTWTEHEANTLRQIAAQRQPQRMAAEVADWCLHVAVEKGRVFDLNAHCRQHYFHPKMGGSTSLKAVLPALWSALPDLRRHAWFADYLREKDGQGADPYETLPAATIDGRHVHVADGSAAMEAYARMLFGAAGPSSDEAHTLRDLLLRYCRLDTLAMVFVWRAWLTSEGVRL